MKNIFLSLILVFSFFSFGWANDEQMLECANAYKSVLRNKKIPANELVTRSYAIIVFPSFHKGALWIGGAGGSGVMLEKIAGSWEPSGVKIGGINIGFQAGYENSEVVIFITSQEVVSHIKEGKFNITSDLAASFGVHGANANDLYSISKEQPMYAYTSNSGLYLGENLGGTYLSPNNEIFSKESYGYREIVSAIGEF